MGTDSHPSETVVRTIFKNVIVPSRHDNREGNAISDRNRTIYFHTI